MNAYSVYLKGRLIDTVFQSPERDGRPTPSKEVKRSLINHDGYDPRIIVMRRRPTKPYR